MPFKRLLKGTAGWLLTGPMWATQTGHLFPPSAPTVASLVRSIFCHASQRLLQSRNKNITRVTLGGRRLGAAARGALPIPRGPLALHTSRAPTVWRLSTLVSGRPPPSGVPRLTRVAFLLRLSSNFCDASQKILHSREMTRIVEGSRVWPFQRCPCLFLNAF